MKFLAAAALAFGVVNGCLPAVARAMSAADIYAQLAPSVWKVQTYDEDGIPLASGSSVVVAPEMLVTNCHVLAHARRVTVKHEKQTVDARLAMWDPARDVCELRAANLTAPPVTIGRGSPLRVGESVYTLGNPRGLDLTMSEGLLSSIRRNDQEQVVLLQTSASISMGSSGGGLFDDRARLIGLTTLVVGGLKPGEAQSLNFAIPVEWVQQLPERHARSVAPRSSAAVASNAGRAGPGTAAAPSNTEANIAHLISPALPGSAASSPSSTLRSIEDATHLPFSNDKMRDAYQRFLVHGSPRAFVIGENGSWYSSWHDSETMKPGTIADVAQRAMLGCQRVLTRCHVYAVDDRVVYDAAKP